MLLWRAGLEPVQHRQPERVDRLRTSITTPAVGAAAGLRLDGPRLLDQPERLPRQQSLRWNVGSYDYFDACIGTLRHDISMA
jgi:hypothetical protein